MSAKPDSTSATIPLFDAKYRWVLLRVLGSLRGSPGIDLDDPEQMNPAYESLRDRVEREIRRRSVEPTPAVVQAIAEKSLSTVAAILVELRREKRDGR